MLIPQIVYDVWSGTGMLSPIIWDILQSSRQSYRKEEIIKCCPHTLLLQPCTVFVYETYYHRIYSWVNVVEHMSGRSKKMSPSLLKQIPKFFQKNFCSINIWWKSVMLFEWGQWKVIGIFWGFGTFPGDWDSLSKCHKQLKYLCKKNVFWGKTLQALAFHHQLCG